MRLVLLAVIALAATSAYAQADGGPCVLDGGTIDQQGKCDGDDAVFCSDPTPANGSLVRMHCPALPMGGLTLTNGNCDILDTIGAWCTFPVGTTCAFVDQSDNTFYMGCGTPTMDNADFVCDLKDGCADVSSTPLLIGCAQTAPRCFGSHLRFDCTAWAQAATIDCTEENGVCTGASGSATCVDGIGGECDNILLTCASGLVCNGLTATALGHCQDPNAPVDAGSQPVDAGQPRDAGQAADAGERDAGTAADAGAARHDAGNTQGGEGEGAGGGEGEGEGGTGIGLGDAPDAGQVAEQPLSSGCGCATEGASPSSAALFAAGLVALAFARRRRQA